MCLQFALINADNLFIAKETGWPGDPMVLHRPLFYRPFRAELEGIGGPDLCSEDGTGQELRPRFGHKKKTPSGYPGGVCCIGAMRKGTEVGRCYAAMLW